MDSGDILNFEDGCLGDYTIVCSCFSIAADMFVGRLRVCRKAKMKCKKGVVLRQNEKDPLRYDYWWEEMEVDGHFIWTIMVISRKSAAGLLFADSSRGIGALFT